jgi:hypothetical protein
VLYAANRVNFWSYPWCVGEGSGRIYNLTRLRSRDNSFEVSIFAAVEFALPPFGSTLIAAVFLVQLLLLADSFSLAFFHAVFFRGR